MKRFGTVYPKGRLVPNSGYDTFVGNAVAVEVPRRLHYAPGILLCQTEESAHGRAPPRETVGSSPCLSCLSRLSRLSRAKPRGAKPRGAKPRGACRRDAIRLEHHSYRTEQACVGRICSSGSSIFFHGVHRPTELGLSLPLSVRASAAARGARRSGRLHAGVGHQFLLCPICPLIITHTISLVDISETSRVNYRLMNPTRRPYCHHSTWSKNSVHLGQELFHR
jgi:hypothetical protein